MCGDLSDRDDFDPPPRRPDLWRERLAAEAEAPDEPAEDTEQDGSAAGDATDEPMP